MWSLVGKTILAYVESDLLELSRLVKKAMENKCWKEREMEHTHLERWTCERGKLVIPRYK
jgi:hypothetical protein